MADADAALVVVEDSQITSSSPSLTQHGAFARVIAQAKEAPWMKVVGALSTANAIALGYHGYKRHRGSVGWTLAWMAMGTFVWPIGWVFALGQGFAQPKGSAKPLAGSSWRVDWRRKWRRGQRRRRGTRP